MQMNGNSVVCVAFDTLLRAPYVDDLGALIEASVEKDSRLSVEGALFAQYYALQRLAVAQNEPFGHLPTFDQTFFNRCKIVVSNPVDGAQILRQAGLAPAFGAIGQRYNQLTPGAHVRVNRPAYLAPITNCSNRAEQMTFENHISGNFEIFTVRWLRTILVQRRKLLKILQGPAEVQTWYDRPRAQVEKLVTALYKRIAWGPEHQDLLQYLDFLAGQHGNALLAQHPLPDAETEFWQGQIDTAVQLLGQHQLPVTDQQLRNQSANYLPFLHHALSAIRLTLIADAHGSEQQKCFDLVPQAHNNAHFIQLDTQGLHRLLLQRYEAHAQLNGGPTPLPPFTAAGKRRFQRDKAAWWAAVVDAGPYTSQRWAFDCCISTDGLDARVYRVLRAGQAGQGANPPPPPAVAPDDEFQEPATWVRANPRVPAFEPQQGAAEVFSETRVVCADPGRRSLYTGVAIKLGETEDFEEQVQDPDPRPLEILKCSRGRYLEESGIKCRNRRSRALLDQHQGLRQHLLATPSSKVATLAEFTDHFKHRLISLAAAPGHQGTEILGSLEVRALRKKSLQRKTRFMESVTRELTHGNPETVVVIGDAKFRHNSRGGPSAPRVGLLRFLAPRCQLYSIDEFRTSLLCSSCRHRMRGLRLPGPALPDYAPPESYVLRRCQNAACPRSTWDRDVNAAVNMMILFGRWWLGEDKPGQFVRGTVVP